MSKLRAAAISFAGGHPQAYSGGLADHFEVELVAVAEVPGENARCDLAEAFAEVHGVPHVEDYVEMLDSFQPDVVSLCVPPASNAEVIVAAAERGIHILSEKPVSDSLASAERALAAVKASGVCFSLDVPNACFPRPLADAQDRARSGGIGKPRVAYCHCLQPKGPRYTYTIVDGEKVTAKYGELPNHGPYGFLAVSKALGQRLRSVFARRNAFFYEHYRDVGHEDMCVATVTFGGGAVANIVVGRTPTLSLPTTEFRLEIIGSAGSVYVDDAMGDKFKIWGPFNDGKDPFERGGLAHQYYTPAHTELYINDVVDAIITGRPPRITVDDALDVIRFIDGCYRSAETGQPVFFGHGAW
ncbi:MAG: Gfo/Idh/MocA family oxidoreductase [Lentisphaerae bacterium]|jgi:UDP-N-acetyl-2-amino-2-deoxyglucuronate dehydrogenase|nr:Gfo/Idh/MocA family oxidoreductase [Lentisphaerota bacterium]MBT5604779.1 Gfo/Idh/MocA family oxidoreductase [Lentisphaerota bacterium]MBT7057023.1 Gfo/Idh/MocA family oxidoreductase [Lentisphaerota bacterium]MBT7845306.1 Gfo/Idh/MocA family oxidoreductase [Lentisphaerota bacterium]